MPNSTVSKLLEEVRKKHPALVFVEAHTFYWSPKQQTVFYAADKLNVAAGQWAFLHEIAHALLGHTTYRTDLSLIACEVAAWQKAVELAPAYNMQIDPNHIEDCLDTYRDWLYARSTCPTCSLNTLQTGAATYKCLNCSTVWRVSPSRFCRPYRMQERQKKTSPGSLQTTFQVTLDEN